MFVQEGSELMIVSAEIRNDKCVNDPLAYLPGGSGRGARVQGDTSRDRAGARDGGF